MNTSKAIGGYFELERSNRGGFPHDDGILLNSGRNALEHVLRSLPGIRHLWIPSYTCEVILEPIDKLSIPYSFYHIDSKFEIQGDIELANGEFLLYTNYFGIMDPYVRLLASRYGRKLIVDNAQALFADPIPDISTIYSPRKFVGVPDGGIAYCSEKTDTDAYEQDYSFDRCSHLLKRIDLGASAGYKDFRDNSSSLVGQPIKKMSQLTRALLSSIDFDFIRTRRIENFKALHSILADLNLLDIEVDFSVSCPMVYPFLTQDPDLRSFLIERNIFIATYWPNVMRDSHPGTTEYDFACRLLAIPCDQRYENKDMDRIINLIKDYVD